MNEGPTEVDNHGRDQRRKKRRYEIRDTGVGVLNIRICSHVNKIDKCRMEMPGKWMKVTRHV